MRKIFIKNGALKQCCIITKVGNLTGEQMEDIMKNTDDIIKYVSLLTKKKLDNYIVGHSSFCYKKCKIGEVYKEESEENGIVYYLITQIISSNMFYCYSIYSR